MVHRIITKWRFPITREIDRRVQLSWVTKRAALSTKRNYCYFRIPKCANSTIVRTLVYYDPDLAYDESDRSGNYAKGCFGHLLDSEARTIREFTERYFSFTFVRNPYSRLLSGYLHKIVEKSATSDRYRAIIDEMKTTAEQTPTFGDFIRYLENGGLWKNPHWVPQTAMLPVQPQHLSFVGKVESIQDDLRTVVDRIFGDGTFKESKTRETHRQGASGKLNEFYTPDIQQRVYRLYRDDFEAFSYDFDLPT